MSDKENQPLGMRNTKQKTLILDCLKRHKNQHMTVDELLEQLKKDKTPVPKATIYRNLSLLEKNSLVKRYTLADNAPACYQFIDKTTQCHTHFHFMCQFCGEIVHFENHALEAAMSNLALSHGFTIDGNKTVFYGTCPTCLCEKDQTTLC